VTPAEARRRFAAARVARLATADADGRPHLVPVVFVVEGDCVYSVVDAKPKRTTALRRLANVAENPAAALLVDHYDDADWGALWWVRAEGRGRVLEPAPAGAGGAPSAEAASAGAASAGAASAGAASAGAASAEAARAVRLLGERYPQQRAVGAVLAVDVERWSGWSARC
jgi:PPOX class probable F420-dependent enzyme